MNLPHQEPILFVQKIEKIEGNKAEASLKFPFLPSFAMMIEAAAQSSVAFCSKECKIGFVTSIKDAELIKLPTINEYLLVELEIKAQVENFLELFFIVKDLEKKEVFSNGSIVLNIK